MKQNKTKQERIKTNFDYCDLNSKERVWDLVKINLCPPSTQ